MKYFKVLLSIIAILFIVSCGSTVKFPVSDLVPAAEISAQAKQDQNGNTEIEIQAKHLANPGRLSPPRDFYVVWIVTDNEKIKNVGRLVQSGSKRVRLKTKTPFKVEEIFITAEKKGNVIFPSNTEITRKKI